MKRSWATLIVALVLTAVVWSMAELQLALVARRFASLSAGHCALAFALYALSYGGRALRLRLLLPGVSSLPHLASVCARHNLFNVVLPFRSGEATLLWMLKREAATSFARGAAALLVSRILDLFSVTACCLLGLTLARPGASQDAAPHVLAFLVGAVLALLLLRPVARRWPAAHEQAGRLRSFLGRTARHVAALSSGRLAGVAATTLATWLLTYGACWLLIQAMAGPGPEGLALGGVSFPQSLVGTTGLHLTAVLPVNTPAAVGVWEAGWTAGYVVAGLDKTAAGTSAIVTHVILFGYMALLGGAGFLLQRRAPPPDDREWSG